MSMNQRKTPTRRKWRLLHAGNMQVGLAAIRRTFRTDRRNAGRRA
jgi:hypothetical protein